VKKGATRRLFPGSNTPEGFYSFYSQGLADMERVFVLKGGPGTGKSTLMRKIALDMTERGYDIDLWQCSSDNDSLDGVIIPALQVAVVDGTAPHVVDPVYPGVVEEIVNLGDFWNQEILRASKDEIKALIRKKSVFYASAYERLLQAEMGRELWRKQSVGLPVEDKIKEVADDLLNEIFYAGLPKVEHYFAGAVTPRGWVDYAQDLSSACSQRYILSGGASQSASAIMQRIADSVIAWGHNVAIYHHPLAPQEIEMVIIPGVKVALLDSDLPGIEPLANDKLVDVCNEAPLTDEEGLSILESSWRQMVKEAVEYIAQAKELHDVLESYYVRSMDFAGLDNVCQEILNKIRSLAAENESREV